MRIIREEIGSATLQGCLLSPSLEMPALLTRPAVLVLPGGGYRYCAEREGEPVATAYLRHGVNAFWLRYSPHADQALDEALGALAALQGHAATCRTGAAQLAIVGLGSGAHLAARLAQAAPRRPSALVLGYPDFSAGRPQADADSPPVFLFAAQDDPLGGAAEALRYALALADGAVPYELHVFGEGGGAMALADSDVTGGNSFPEAAAWLGMSARFLRRVWAGGMGASEEKDYEHSADTPLGQLMRDGRCAALCHERLGKLWGRLEANAMVAGMTPRQLAGYARGMISAEALDALDEALRALRPVSKPGPRYNCIRPGKVWRDTRGKRIQAHGGAMWYEDGVYYWYGENKEHTDGKSDVWTSGIRAYSSADLYNWKDEGLIIPPSEDPRSNLHASRRVDRPHIIRPRATGRYVCWLKLCGAEACFVVLSAEKLLGPYRVERESYRPGGIPVGDFDIVQDAETGAHYLYMDADHAAVACFALSDDGLSAREELSRSYEGLHAPFCREGVALFDHGGRKYMLTSGMTGYIPNQSDSAVADRWNEPFRPLGDPHENDASHASFNSQISKVFEVRGAPGLYIAMADRWVPDYVVDARRADVIARGIANRYDPARYPVTEEERREVMECPMLTGANTSIADYVWLPVQIENGRPIIRWRDSWRIEDYIREGRE